MADATGNSQQVHGTRAHDAAAGDNPVQVGGYASDAPPTAVGADGRNCRIWVDRFGRVQITSRAATSTRSSVAASETVVTVLAANAARLGATVYNDSNSDLYLALGAAASASDFTVKMTKNTFFEAPFGYTGIITGVWSSASGNARVTELT